MLNRPPRADSDEDEPIFGMHPGDLGVIAIAALFTAAFLLILFSRWQMPSMSGLLSAPPPPKARPVPKGETEIMILPAPAKKDAAQP